MKLKRETILNSIRFVLALIAVAWMWRMAYREGVVDGERGLAYWEGWQDAMTETDYGRKPANAIGN